MDLRKSKNGLVIHRPTCRWAGHCSTWAWAKDQEHEQVVKATSEWGYRACRVCRPFAFPATPSARGANQEDLSAEEQFRVWLKSKRTGPKVWGGPSAR